MGAPSWAHLNFSFEAGYLTRFKKILGKARRHQQRSVKCRGKSDILDSIWSLPLGLTRDAELHILANSKPFWAVLQSRVVEEELPRPLTALDEPKLASHGDDLQSTQGKSLQARKYGATGFGHLQHCLPMILQNCACEVLITTSDRHLAFKCRVYSPAGGTLSMGRPAGPASTTLHPSLLEAALGCKLIECTDADH